MSVSCTSRLPIIESSILPQSPTVLRWASQGAPRHQKAEPPAQWHRYVTCRHTISAAPRSHRTVLLAAIFAQPSSLCDRMTGESVTASALEKAASTLSDTVTDDQSRHEFSSQPSSLCGRMTGESVTASAQPAQAIIPASMHYRHPAAIKT